MDPDTSTPPAAPSVPEIVAMAARSESLKDVSTEDLTAARRAVARGNFGAWQKIGRELARRQDDQRAAGCSPVAIIIRFRQSRRGVDRQSGPLSHLNRRFR